MGWKAFEAEKPGRSDRKADETSLETAGRRGVKKLLRFFCGFFVIIKEILKNILIIQIKFSSWR